MTTRPKNRPHAVDKATGDFLFILYGVLFEATGLDARTKQRTFEAAANSKNSWRVVSISEDALKHLQNTKSAKGLQRGHILSRVDRAAYLFNRKGALNRDELLNYFFEHDTVALVTKTENSKKGIKHWSPIHEVPEGLFNAGSFAIYARKHKELAWVEIFNPTNAG